MRHWLEVRKEALRAAILRVSDGVEDGESFSVTRAAARKEVATARAYDQLRRREDSSPRSAGAVVVLCAAVVAGGLLVAWLWSSVFVG